MGNCLKTQLKEVVNNDDLIKVGELVVEVNDLDVASDFRVSREGNYNPAMFIEGDGYFINSDTGDNLGKTLPADTVYFEYLRVSPGTYKIHINNKYGLTALFVSSAHFTFDSEQMDYLTSLETLAGISGSMNCEFKGNTDWLKHVDAEGFYSLATYWSNITTRTETLAQLPALIAVRSYSHNITGDVSLFAANTALAELSIPNTGITGNLVSLLDGNEQLYNPNLRTINISNTNIICTDDTYNKLIAAGVTSITR